LSWRWPKDAWIFFICFTSTYLLLPVLAKWPLVGGVIISYCKIKYLWVTSNSLQNSIPLHLLNRVKWLTLPELVLARGSNYFFCSFHCVGWHCGFSLLPAELIWYSVINQMISLLPSACLTDTMVLERVRHEHSRRSLLSEN